MTNTTDSSRPASRPYTGAEYIESIRDGREVWLNGERVEDVTTHPAFRNNVRMAARLYDALHDPEQNERLVVPTDTGSGGYTHAYFKAARTPEDLRAGADAIADWSRITYGWMGRTPDFKAAFLATLGSYAEHYAPFEDNADRWYREAQEKVMFVGHGIVNPPIDRHRGMQELKDVYLTVDEETDAGIIVSGAKVVGTAAAITQQIFIGSYAKIPSGAKEFSAYFIVPMGAPGLKIISRPSYEFAASTVSSPFDAPLSSRLDENDGILVFDRVFVPWEDVFCYDVDKANNFFVGSGFFYRAMLHACVRFAVKMDFLTGLLTKGLETTGTIEYRGVQSRLGEVLSYRNIFWALIDSMVHNPTPWPDGTVAPNGETAMAFRVLATSVFPRIKETFFRDLGSALIYNNSHASDWKIDELRPYLDRYIRGRDVEAIDRVKLMKLIWDSLGSEFGGRWELYEMNYAGNHEQIRFEALHDQQHTGKLEQYKELVERCMSEYDIDGWTVPDLVNPGEQSIIGRTAPRSGSLVAGS
ncbi:pyoverdin chromophore biosynthetic protein pvcC [Longimycelium tulufanense]|uniref:Pyoverdin chromophore biosynthetic protein pvcC n=1 Tax=Longimycelium tulufanense TaxID=907463 RepID=A0A8J3C867_9PSEU|nr:4-hydroxyphenylacetate 3-hydroxylase N-terminal domain-containing protein [Longimycelium tulufanense]GGM52956.1 pyoverdin chromophore biosynthetic protein pvcC [Longimycelium tulufanense]